MSKEAACTREEVRNAILAVRDAMIRDGRAADHQAINRGLCDDLACEVHGLLSAAKQAGHEGVKGLAILSVAEFIRTDPATGFSYDSGGPFDRALIKRHWPGVKPPEGLDWDGLDALSRAAGFDAGTHVFLHHDGLFFDAEEPEGTPSFFDLPFFRRVSASWIEEGRPGPDAGDHKDQASLLAM